MMKSMKHMRIATVCLGFLSASLASPAYADCKCVANGKSYALGETACIGPPRQQRQARCEMVLNLTSWTFIEGSCLSASTAGNERLALMCTQNDAESLETTDQPSAGRRSES